MKIYGTGVLTALGTSRVVHDFVDGPFETVNPALLEEARRRGYSFSPPCLQSEDISEQVDKTEPIIEEPKDTPKKRGRPAKGK
jgi:hypothetical protein